MMGAVEALFGDLRGIGSVMNAARGWTASNKADFFGESLRALSEPFWLDGGALLSSSDRRLALRLSFLLVERSCSTFGLVVICAEGGDDITS